MIYIRALAPLLAALVLGACGFHPLYATDQPGGGPAAAMARIYVGTDDTEIVGYELRNNLIDLLRGTMNAKEARYRLTFRVRQTREGVSIAPDAAITRYDYTLTVTYTLTDAKTLATITQGQEVSRTAYDVVSSPYSTLVAQQSAQKDASQDIASRIQTDLAVYFSQHPQA